MKHSDFARRLKKCKNGAQDYLTNSMRPFHMYISKLNILLFDESPPWPAVEVEGEQDFKGTRRNLRLSYLDLNKRLDDWVPTENDAAEDWDESYVRHK